MLIYQRVTTSEIHIQAGANRDSLSSQQHLPENQCCLLDTWRQSAPLSHRAHGENLKRMTCPIAGSDVIWGKLQQISGSTAFFSDLFCFTRIIFSAKPVQYSVPPTLVCIATGDSTRLTSASLISGLLFFLATSTMIWCISIIWMCLSIRYT